MMFRIAAVAVIVAGVVATEANAQTATQVVTFEVQAINQIAVTGTPSLTISAAVAGVAPTSVSAAASYAITTNESNRKITAVLDADMPSGVTLSIDMAAPALNGSGQGVKPLSTGAQDLVTGISALNESGLAIEYTLSATSAAGVVASDTRTVTFTVEAGA